MVKEPILLACSDVMGVTLVDENKCVSLCLELNSFFMQIEAIDSFKLHVELVSGFYKLWIFIVNLGLFLCW